MRAEIARRNFVFTVHARQRWAERICRWDPEYAARMAKEARLMRKSELAILREINRHHASDMTEANKQRYRINGDIVFICDVRRAETVYVVTVFRFNFRTT